MGCVSSTLLNQNEDFTSIGRTNALGHHFVSLTSTTYGLLTLDPPTPSTTTTTTPPTHSPRFTRRLPDSPPRPEIINSWELMAGLDSNDSFRFQINNNNQCKSKPCKIWADPDTDSLTPPSKVSDSRLSKIWAYPNIDSLTPTSKDSDFDKENSHPNHPRIIPSKPLAPKSNPTLDGFEILCPPNGEDKLVIYTTTLRGVRKTFEACNALRSVIQGLGFAICERDISMDRGFKDELNELLRDKKSTVPPRVFANGRYLGGVDEILTIHEDGFLYDLLSDFPKVKGGEVCDGCGGIRFLPCFQCNGSCKLVMEVKKEEDLGKKIEVVMKCPDCNENGLVLCPICS